MLSDKDPATTIDPVMTSCQWRMHMKSAQQQRILAAASSHCSFYSMECCVTDSACVCVSLCATLSAALAVYSLLFARWSLAVSPANYPLLLCHISNEVIQLVQLGRYASAQPSTAKAQA